MRIFVDELPKDCIECPFCQDIKVNAGMDRLLFCKANKGKAIKNIEKSFDKCIVKNEFQSLSDHDNQERKEVFERLDKTIEKYLCKKGKYRESLDISSTTKQVMKENLDQIQGK